MIDLRIQKLFLITKYCVYIVYNIDSSEKLILNVKCAQREMTRGCVRFIHCISQIFNKNYLLASKKHT